MLRAPGASSSSSYSSGAEDGKPFASTWPLWLRGTRTVAVPRRVLFLFLTVLAASVALHLWSYGRIHALESQLHHERVQPSDSAGVTHAPAAGGATIDQVRALVGELQRDIIVHTKQQTQTRPIEAVREAARAVVVDAPPPVQSPPSVNVVGAGALLPPPPPPITLTPAQVNKLEEPWRWFETSGEHKDLINKVRTLRSDLGRPLLILDIGLNIGSAPYALEKVCPDCVIIGFEPIPQYFAFASLKLTPTRYPHVSIYNYAICDHVGEETIYMDTSNNVGWNTLIAAEKTSSQVAVKIQCVTIDALVAAKIIPSAHIDLIKIDTEGAEHLVLTGMQGTIAAHADPKPWMYIEVGWGVSRKDWPAELKAFQFLFEHGYETYDMSKITGTSMHWMTPKGLQSPDFKSERQLNNLLHFIFEFAFDELQMNGDIQDYDRVAVLNMTIVSAWA